MSIAEHIVVISFMVGFFWLLNEICHNPHKVCRWLFKDDGRDAGGV